MQRERVTEHIYIFTSDLYVQVTAGVVVTSAGAIIIDTLLYPEETLLMKRFVEERLGLSVRYVINTHHHADHVAGLDDLRRFYEHGEEETSELRIGFERFLSYSYEERRRLVDKLKRFFTCARDPVYGDGAVPSLPERGGPVMDNHRFNPDWE